MDCSFDSYKISTGEQREAVEELKRISSKFTDCVLINSKKPGTGKTHLAVALMRKLMQEGFFEIHFISSPFLFLDIKNSFDNKECSESSIIKKYCGYGFLIIDDIGVEKISEWAQQIWYMIIDQRYSEMRPTIFTSNMSLGDIARDLGTRIASRLGGGIVLTIEGQDMRIQK